MQMLKNKQKQSITRVYIVENNQKQEMRIIKNDENDYKR